MFFGNLVLLPQWMQEYLNYRSVDAGLVTAPLGVFAVLLAPVMGRVLPRSDARVIATLAFVGFAIVFYMRSKYVIEIDTWHLVIPTLLQGIPMALFFVPLTSIILSGQPSSEDSGGGGSVEFRARILRRGGHVDRGQRVEQPHGAASRTAHRAGHHQQPGVQSADRFDPVAAASEFAIAPHALFDFTVNTQAAMMGLNDIFFVSAVIFILIIPLIWITRPAKGGGGPDAAGAH